MAPKRPHESSDVLTGRDRKKQKMAAARTIAVQPPPAPTTTNAEAGPSKITPVNDSMARLPNVIDVERFVDARAYEVNAMKDAMQASSSSASHRVWQTLPRELRRRAASHDVRRVPTRLREKARAEMDIKRVPGKPKSKRGKEKQVPRTEDFLKRQRDKTWLETHIWHAKRMKMETKWGYRIAIHPSEKAFRPSHRASIHGSILHDASYQSIIELSGQQTVLKLILDNCCSPQAISPGAARFVLGAKTAQTLFYESKAYPFGLISPVTIMWQPPVAPVAQGDASSSKGKEKAMDTEPRRVLWIRAHPAVHDQIFDALHESASSVLDAFKNGSASEPVEVEIVDMRGKVNIFDIMGPKSSQVLKGALQPLASDNRAEFKDFWSSLTDLQSTASVPRGMVIGLTVNDPRLKFPPKNAKPSGKPGTSHSLPCAKLAESGIWDETQRKTPKFKKKDLDDRRAKNLIPGTKLTALRQDDRVPVMLIQRSLEHSSTTSPASFIDNAESLHGWTLIIPAGWSMAFFSSLIFTGTRVGGQRECQTQAFEAGVPHFPRDYPFTEMYKEYADEVGAEDKRVWERKPPAKRPNFEKVGTRSPWKPDWEVIMGLKAEGNGQEELMTTQRDPEESGNSEGGVKPWLLCMAGGFGKILDELASCTSPGMILAAKLNEVRGKRGLDPLSVGGLSLLQGALVHVRVKMHKRGCPEDRAIFYSMSDEEVLAWDKEVKKSAVEKAAEIDDDEDNKTSPAIPPSSSIIGYATTGHFSLMRGEAFALGSVPLARYIELKHQSRRLRFKIVVRVKNPSHDLCRIAYMELS